MTQKNHAPTAPTTPDQGGPMTDHDNLRDRIAYILESHAHLAMDQQACAIIDELGLEIEWQSMRWMDPNGPDRSWRVVGKWEKE